MGINYMARMEEKDRKTFPFKAKKAKFHKVAPTSLEILLLESDGFFSTYLNAGGYDICTVGIGGWNNEKDAKKEFRKISKALEEGRYTLQLYGNGKVELNLK